MAKSKSKNTYTKEQLFHWYRQMMVQRRFEEKAGQLYGMQKIKGFCHLYIGQEAVSTGVEAAIRPDDYVITAYRDHGQALVRGVTSRACMAELYGKATGCTKGKGGSMHFFSKEHNFLGGHGIVGGQIPLGAGIAFSAKYLKTDKVCVCYFGDGAARQGALHEAFNMAMTWKLPVIFICENNLYAMGTSVERTSNVVDIWKLGLAYDMPAEPVDGMDMFTVKDAMEKAVNRARTGEGPTLLEIKTYRYRGHSMSDPAKYRTKEELEKYKDMDPIMHLKSYILEHKMATADELDAIDESVKDEINDCVTFAENSPYPDASELYTEVYSEPNYPFITE